MTVDKQEIKVLALACTPARCADEAEESRRLAEFYSELTPEFVLALIEEIELIGADRKACWEEFKIQGRQLDQAKAEGEALRKDAERYRGVRRVANRQGFTDEQFDQQTDSKIARFDAAMAKEASRG
ncbi:hypothetical protein G7007_08145 [Pseudomonas entomophila]|uniref:hypothetical protein n=1 Tax=Pseudomonas entomophila TaxID=312306 RepID=UPI0015E42150|nr:hypothetical protein [Pseudomonas entomophila]MBA1192829.1 hypothetical protein [Pseudomonas entomophila]